MKFKTKRFVYFAALFLIFGQNAFAGDQFGCKVAGVGVFSKGWYLQCEGGTRSNPPPCASVPTQWAMSWGHSQSKAFYTLALTHSVTGVPVRLSGGGGQVTCDVLGNREDITVIEKSGM
mgnify:CR=1 FL=1